ncbi:MAG: type II toxin-antitoxin system PemK/MazF family toxin [Chloroflexi bacterium]|nr:type II toxin-antitoxin system PemK/MazF family toxin [Chloroflexota bacterium]
MRRGEVWWAELSPPAGRRPVLLLSRDEAYDIREFIIVSPLTTRRRGLRTEVSLGPEDGLLRSSIANLDVIITEPKNHLQRRIASLRPERLEAVDAALHFALGLKA